MAAKPPATTETPGMDPAKLYVWVKSLESKANSMLREMDLLKNSTVRKGDDLKREMKAMNDELLEMKREQHKMSQQMDLIIKELKQTAGVEEVAVLKKYIELWNPLSFVTQKDLDRALDAKIVVLRETALKTSSDSSSKPIK
ncbi:MAG: hypothetical protein AABY26_00165 [Nanoarchaeota archaeon]